MALAFLHGVGGGGKHLDDLKGLIDRSITELEIPEGVEKIGQYSIMMCNYLTNLVIPETVTKIDNYGITTLSALEYLNIPDSVTEIGENVLYGCGKMKEIRFGKKLEKIGNGCFRTLKAIISFDFTACEQVPQLGTGCFALNNADAKIIVPASLYEEWIEATNWAAFKDYIVKAEPVPSKGLAYEYSGGAYTVSAGGWHGEKLVIPATYNDGVNGEAPVKKVASYGFADISELKSVTIEGEVFAEDVTKTYQMFPGCDNLSYLSIKEQTFVGMFSFRNPAISTVVFEKLEEIDPRAFGSKVPITFDFSASTNERPPTIRFADSDPFGAPSVDMTFIMPTAWRQYLEGNQVDTNWEPYSSVCTFEFV